MANYFNFNTTPITGTLNYDTTPSTSGSSVLNIPSSSGTSDSSGSAWLSSNPYQITAVQGLSVGAQGVASVLNAFSSYSTAKHNYTLTVRSAQDLLEQSEKQIDQLNMEYYQNSETNRAYISGLSGLEGGSYSDVMRMNFSEKENTITDMRAYAQKQADQMIAEAKRAKKKAKQGRVGTMAGGILGGIAGGIVGGPMGASVGFGLGSQIGHSAGQM